VNLTRTLYRTSPAGVRRAVARLVPEPLKARVRPALSPSGFTQTWENPDISLYLDPDYQHLNHVWRSQELVVEYVRQTLRYAEAPLSLLDAGCGNGRLYRALAQAGLLERLGYTGVDVTQKLVEAARTLYPDGAFEQGSMNELPYPDDSFDIVVCQHVVRYLDYYERALAELLRVSRGTVVLVEKQAVDQDVPGTYYNETLASHFHLNLYGAGKLKAFARAKGAVLAFTLNDSRVDEPGGQAVYVFHKPVG
jgi:SAM-dependent methyltransferase